MKAGAMGTTSTKEIAPLTGEAKVAQLNKIRDQYKGETSASHQQRMLAALRYFPISTFEARTHLDVPHPAGRIQELRELGWDIRTLRRIEHSDIGRPHCIALYVLQGRKQAESASVAARAA
ncbi:protein of unknown function [Georgfuchsia toluolica]|uniref:Winged helix-turn-helix domain-containing protein n=1 Tax=Georgfuchsia toluolica TaxID=424218 RepID=A0A916J1S4_9PROT|nr:helix-turn-helix domain-containing protein [Georgfuchsia toluolica]CAG4882997.1 protein of unknown function [Georgfuchsia toluolica]